MDGKYLLDSNIIVALFNGDPTIEEQINNSGEVYLPVIALGELYYGAYNSTKKQTNLDRIDEF